MLVFTFIYTWLTFLLQQSIILNLISVVVVLHIFFDCIEWIKMKLGGY